MSSDPYRHVVSRLAAVALADFLASGARLRFEAAAAPRVSVLLVLHGRAELTLRCLLSLRGTAAPFEVVLVDNASADDTPRLLRRLDGVTLLRNEVNLGFLRAANQAARLARGATLLFLNNDCELLPGSLEAALSTLERDDTVGAVGGKLVQLDGRLQEAGGIVWRDGACSGYGRGQSPTAPEFAFQRDVDYCSGALLLTRRSLFLECGGFDEAFQPAYYEDADYCLRLWAAGHRVVYEPRAAAVHVEFASSPSPEAALTQQAARRPLFRARHAAALARQPDPHGASPLAARERGPGLRVLFVDDRVPHAWLGAGYPRSAAIVAGLRRLGHRVTYYPLMFPTEGWETVYATLPRDVEVVTGHGLDRFLEFRRQRPGYHDVVIVSRDHNLRALRRLVGEGPLFGTAPIVHDAEALQCLREVGRRRLSGEQVPDAEAARLLAEEIALARGASVVTCAAPAEADRFRAAGFDPVLLGHCVTAAAAGPPFDRRQGLLFVGAIPDDESPNADALGWFLEHVLPRLRDALGAPVPVTLVGEVRSRRFAERLPHGVTHLGPVEDPSGPYAEARVFVAPTRFGAGVPLKVLDAAAHGLPVVATGLLAAQLGWQDGSELLVGDDAESFARRCAELHSEPERWERVRARALERVLADCSPRAFDAALCRVLERAVGSGAIRGHPAARPEALRVQAGADRPAPSGAPHLLDDRDDRLTQAVRALQDSRREVAALRASLSWRLTAPLRRVHGWMFRPGRRP